VPLDLLGVLDMNAAPGQVLLVPGALFEAVALPIWLIAKGFATPASADAHHLPARPVISTSASGLGVSRSG
jgi:hypothetical protein